MLGTAQHISMALLIIYCYQLTIAMTSNGTLTNQLKREANKETRKVDERNNAHKKYYYAEK
jgi:hypothetical protein